MRRSSGIAAPKQQRSGTVTLLITDLTKPVVFDTPMPSANYTIHFEPTAAIAMLPGTGSKTTTGFNVLSTGLAFSTKYKAIED